MATETTGGLQRIEKLAERAGISTASIRRGIERREIRGVRVGKIFLVPDDEIDRLRQLADANLRPVAACDETLLAIVQTDQAPPAQSSQAALPQPAAVLTASTARPPAAHRSTVRSPRSKKPTA